MSYCINPLCEQRQNPDSAEICLSCGTPLIIRDRIRLLKPLKELTYDPEDCFEVFEVDDTGAGGAGTKSNKVPKRRVMKVLKWNSERYRGMIERESLALKLIKHPNIPESGLDDFFFFTPNKSILELRCLVMDKIEGEDLEKWIKSHEKISQSVAMQWIKQLVQILDIVHRNEFFHRDIKPANIMLRTDGQLVLIDFGSVRRITGTYLAKIGATGGTDTKIGQYEITSIISHYYSPPEQIHGKAVPQSDFYALGRTFIRLVTGTSLVNLPIDEKAERLLWRKHAPQIDKPFADLIDDLVNPVVAKRPMSTENILQRLEKLPGQSKIHQIATSPLFRVGTVVAGLLIILGLGYVSLPVAASYFLEKGKKAQKENRLAEAEEKFQLAVWLYPNTSSSVSQFWVDQANNRNNSPEISRKYYELAIKYNSKNDVAYNNLALVCQQLRDIECVEKSYQVLFKIAPNSWEGHYGLGIFYDDYGKYDLAKKEYKRAIQISSQAVHAINNLSRLKNLSGDYSTAATLALQGLERTQDVDIQTTLYKNLGWAKLEQKHYDEAKTYLEKSIKLNPSADAYCLLAQVQEKKGKTQDARLSWEACLLAASSSPEVQGWRQKLLDRVLGTFVPKSPP
ncbi:serine/threonine-protein kinase [Nostoc sp. CHAB 5844]|nr:serine/threonine-protein kinase [Nostoc sp. CHAB 5844]